MKKNKDIRDLKFYKTKLETTIGSISALLSLIILIWITEKVSLQDIENGWIILLVVGGIISGFFVFMSIFELIIKFLVYGRKLK